MKKKQFKIYQQLYYEAAREARCYFVQVQKNQIRFYDHTRRMRALFYWHCGRACVFTKTQEEGELHHKELTGFDALALFEEYTGVYPSRELEFLLKIST